MTDRIDPDTPAKPLPLADITGEIIGAFYETWNELGFGFLESVYRRSLVLVLRERGLEVREEAPVMALFRGEPVGLFRLDLLVEGSVAVELKATSVLGPTDKRQLMNYLRATDLDVGLLLHFGPEAKFIRVASPRMLKRRG
jgi:GxxExxY protein